MAELEGARREHEQLGVLLLDIDHFKHINDGNGHLVGDDVILLCPGVDQATLVEVAERARATIEQVTIEHQGRAVRVTMSIGAAHFPEAGPELEDLLLAADNALFAAKNGQRN